MSSSLKRKTKKPNNPRERKKQVRLACVACRKAKTACDNERPCHRCSSRGIENCVDAPKKSRGNTKTSCIESNCLTTTRTRRKRIEVNYNIDTFSEDEETDDHEHFDNNHCAVVKHSSDSTIDFPLVVFASGSCSNALFDVTNCCSSPAYSFFNVSDNDLDDPCNEYTPFGGLNVLGIISLTPSFDQVLASIVSEQTQSV